MTAIMKSAQVWARRSMSPFVRFLRAENGAILVESAFVFPILIVLLLGSVEIGRYILLHQKLERVSSSVADLVAQSDDDVTLAEVQSLFGIAPHIAAPFDISANGLVTITAVTREEDDIARIAWQLSELGDLVQDSDIGTVVGAAANLPEGFVLPEGETVIIGEAWYDYESILLRFVQPDEPVYHRAFFRPRISDLDTAPE